MDTKNSAEEPESSPKTDEKNSKIPVRGQYPVEEYRSKIRDLRTSAQLDPSVSDHIAERARQYAAALSPKDIELGTMIEDRLKKGSTGLELIEYVKQVAQCDSDAAFDIVRGVAKRSSDVIKATFSQDQVIMMAFDLYSRACVANKIQDAARLLQAIIALVNEQKGATKDQFLEREERTRVNIVEFLPPAKD